MKLFTPLFEYADAFLHLLYPNICLACGNEGLSKQMPICRVCLNALPFTNFFSIANNPVEKIFWGRSIIQYAGAALFFTKESIVQTLLFELKYKQNKKAGDCLGKIIGTALLNNPRYAAIEYMIPIPIGFQKTRIRGYNQSMIIAKGIQSVWNRPIVEEVLCMGTKRASQTKKDRLERVQQIGQCFKLQNPALVLGKNILLIDDVITTGATMEAASQCLQAACPKSIHVAAVAYTL